MMNSKILYKLSIILNIFLILVSGSLLYHKRDKIINLLVRQGGEYHQNKLYQVLITSLFKQ